MQPQLEERNEAATETPLDDSLDKSNESPASLISNATEPETRVVDCEMCVIRKVTAERIVQRKLGSFLDRDWWIPLRCGTCETLLLNEQAKKEQIAKVEAYQSRMTRSNLPQDYLRGQRGFVDLDRLTQTDGLVVARRICARLVSGKHDKPWVWLCDDKGGTGKTTLAACTVIERIRSEFDAWFINWPDLLADLRASYGDEAEETEFQIMMRARSVSWLILDDVGAEKPKQAATASDTLYQILNARSSLDTSAKPGSRGIIITSNDTIAELLRKYLAHLEDPKMATRLERRLYDFATEVPLAA